jgi:lysozyme family protein
MTVDDILDGILEREGGFVDHPADRGGATKYGITQATLSDWLGHPASVEDVRTLPVGVARAIYRRRYLEAPGYAEAIANDRLLALVVDFAVHSGPGRATAALQRVLGVTDDGVIGAQTRRVLASQAGSVEVYRRFLAARIGFLCRLAVRDPSQLVFLDGWLHRVVSFL